MKLKVSGCPLLAKFNLMLKKIGMLVQNQKLKTPLQPSFMFLNTIEPAKNNGRNVIKLETDIRAH